MEETMELSIGKSRVEAFSDAVIAIIITVMVLELPYPDSNSLEQMKNFIIALFVFFDSFFIVGSFWHKHCLLFQKSKDVSSKMVWRNLLFLFTISGVYEMGYCRFWTGFSSNSIYFVVYCLGKMFDVFIRF